VPKVSTAHLSGCSSPSVSICLAPFLYIASPSILPEIVLNCQIAFQGFSPYSSSIFFVFTDVLI
jgi:hypothetical protein